MFKITRGKLREWNACYSDSRIDDIFRAKKTDELTPLQVANMRSIPPKDRLWVLLREEIIPKKQLRLLACGFAERALLRERKAGREPDERSWEAIEISRKFALGEVSETEKIAAADAADAAYAAADAADAATYAAPAAYAAAYAAHAAYDAAIDAAADAAYAAAYDAAYDPVVSRLKEQKRQLALVKKALSKFASQKSGRQKKFKAT